MKYHTVVKGDTLSKIAAQYGTTTAQLLEWNPDITDPNLIRVGQIIIVGVPDFYTRAEVDALLAPITEDVSNLTKATSDLLDSVTLLSTGYSKLEATVGELAVKLEEHMVNSDTIHLAVGADIEALDVRVAKLEMDVPNPEPPDQPPSGQFISQGDNFQAIIMGAAPGTIFNVEAGAVFPNVVLGPALPDGIQVWCLDPANPFVLDGGGTIHRAFNFPTATGTVWSGMLIRNYAGFVNPDWNNVEGDSFRAPRAVEAADMTETLFIDCEVSDCDSGWMGPKSGQMIRCSAHRNRHMNIAINNADGLQIEGFHHSFGNWDGNYNWQWEAGVKFVHSRNIVVRGWEAHDNRSPGFWPDGSNEVWQVEDLTAYDNAGPGLFHEINTGAFQYRRVDCRRNGGAACLYIANSYGPPGDPILVEDFHVEGHTAGHNWQTAVADDGNRPFRSGNILFRNGVIVGHTGMVFHRVNGAPPFQDIVLENVVNEHGQPVVPVTVT